MEVIWAKTCVVGRLERLYFQVEQVMATDSLLVKSALVTMVKCDYRFQRAEEKKPKQNSQQSAVRLLCQGKMIGNGM